MNKFHCTSKAQDILNLIIHSSTYDASFDKYMILCCCVFFLEAFCVCVYYIYYMVGVD